MESKIFSNEIVNGGRQKELDLAKAVLLFFLPYIHCIIECTPEPQLDFGIPYVFDSIIGGPLSAPMYMFAMGVGMAYARRHTPRDFFMRALQIEAAGYALNLFRFVIPSLLGYILTQDAGHYFSSLPYQFFGNDILQFAGLAMMLTALFLRWGLSERAMLAVGFVFSLFGTALRGADFGSPALNVFLGYFIGTTDTAGLVISDFPLLNWFIVPVCGYLFGKKLLYVKNKAVFYRTLSVPAFAAAVLYFGVRIAAREGMFAPGQNSYYHISTPDIAASLAMTVGLLGIYFVLAQRIPKPVMDGVSTVSRSINAIYCIHWVIVAIVTRVVLYAANGTQMLALWPVMALSTAISAVSIGLAYLWSARCKKMLSRWRQ